MEGESEVYKKGLWLKEEDNVLIDYVRAHGRGQWNRIPKVTGLKRSGKSCRLRWMNYLSPNVKHGDFSEQEDDLIIRIHKLVGNRWSLIAGRVPGRTDNQIKNHWNTNLKKKLLVLGKKTNERVSAKRIRSSDQGSGEARKVGHQDVASDTTRTDMFGVLDDIDVWSHVWSPATATATDFNSLMLGWSEDPPL